MSKLNNICFTLAVFALFLPAIAPAQTLVENSSEIRFQIDLKVSDEALKPYLPAGFTPNVATQGGAKDCNLRVIFIDRIAITGPDNKSIGSGSNRLVNLVVPVKDPSGNNAQLVIGGLTEDPSDAPGPFGNYLLATTHDVRRTTTDTTGPIIDTQDWTFVAKSGERLELHLKFERGPGSKGRPNDAKYYSATNPSFYQISHQEQALDILRNTTLTPPDHVKEFSMKASGGSYDKLFGKTLTVLSWDNIIWINRAISTP